MSMFMSDDGHLHQHIFGRVEEDGAAGPDSEGFESFWVRGPNHYIIRFNRPFMRNPAIVATPFGEGVYTGEQRSAQIVDIDPQQCTIQITGDGGEAVQSSFTLIAFGDA